MCHARNPAGAVANFEGTLPATSIFSPTAAPNFSSSAAAPRQRNDKRNSTGCSKAKSKQEASNV